MSSYQNHNLLPIQWHTGMALLAQHFQHEQKFNKQMLLAITNTGIPMWGTIDIEMEFVNGIVTIKSLDCLMKDLTRVVIDKNNALNYLSVTIPKKLDYGQEYSVFLCIENTPNTQLIGPVCDDFDQNVKDVISVLTPNAKLIFSKEEPPKYSSIKLMSVQMIKDEIIKTDYQYPFIKWPIGALYQKLLNLRLKLRGKLEYLQAQSKTSTQDLSFIRAYLIKGLLDFEEQIEAKRHPYFLFQSLLNLVANLACINLDHVPTLSYQHDNLAITFEKCIEYADLILDAIQESYRVINFKKNKDMWKIPLADLKLYQEHGKQYYVCSAHMFENYEVLDDWIKSSVIASSSMIESLLDSRTLGADREIREYVNDLRFRSSKDMLFFYIEYDEHFIKNDEFLVIANNAIEEDSPDEVCGYSN